MLKKSISGFITQCLGILSKMRDNVLFKNPNVSYDEVSKEIQELINAEDDAKNEDCRSRSGKK